MPGIREAVEMVDVSTPATVIRYTGNWCGSQEGWLFKPGGGSGCCPNSLPGLKQFMMVGQWIMPGRWVAVGTDDGAAHGEGDVPVGSGAVLSRRGDAGAQRGGGRSVTADGCSMVATLSIFGTNKPGCHAIIELQYRDRPASMRVLLVVKT